MSRKILQLSLLLFGISLILVTYFLYPKINKNLAEKGKNVKEEMLNINKSLSLDYDKKKFNTFENVEYKGIYGIDKPFTVKSQQAHILNENPDIVHMSSMEVTMYMVDGRIINIKSDKGKYNKITYDCFFEDNVIATDGETTVLAKNLDLMVSEDNVVIYNNVILNNDQGSLYADRVDYDLETKYYRSSMFNDEKVKVKLIK